MSISIDEVLVLPNAVIPIGYDKLYILRSVPGVIAYTRPHRYAGDYDIVFGLKSQYEYEDVDEQFLVNHNILPEFRDEQVKFAKVYLTPHWSWHQPSWHKSYSYRYDTGNLEYILEQFNIIKQVYNKNIARNHGNRTRL